MADSSGKQPLENASHPNPPLLAAAGAPGRGAMLGQPAGLGQQRSQRWPGSTSGKHHPCALKLTRSAFQLLLAAAFISVFPPRLRVCPR